jgi:hypothetical protein
VEDSRPPTSLQRGITSTSSQTKEVVAALTVAVEASIVAPRAVAPVLRLLPPSTKTTSSVRSVASRATLPGSATINSMSATKVVVHRSLHPLHQPTTGWTPTGTWIQVPLITSLES